MMKNNSIHFDLVSFVKACLSAYLIPLMCSGIPGLLLNDPDLIKASYSTIALTSLLATAICFMMLSEFQRRQIFLLNRIKMIFILCPILTMISFLVICLLNIQNELWNIVPSTVIGSIVIILKKPLFKQSSYESL